MHTQEICQNLIFLYCYPYLGWFVSRKRFSQATVLQHFFFSFVSLPSSKIKPKAAASRNSIFFLLLFAPPPPPPISFNGLTCNYIVGLERKGDQKNW